MLSTRQAADILQVSQRSVQLWAKAGLIKSRWVGNQRVFEESDVRKFAEVPRNPSGWPKKKEAGE